MTIAAIHPLGFVIAGLIWLLGFLWLLAICMAAARADLTAEEQADQEHYARQATKPVCTGVRRVGGTRTTRRAA